MAHFLIAALALTVLSATTAHAQLFGGKRSAPSENAIQSAESERVYQRALKNIPDKKVSKDPWRNTRTATPEPFDRHTRSQ